jgi:uncharacterized protein with ATP-grasp and redox domains
MFYSTESICEHTFVSRFLNANSIVLNIDNTGEIMIDVKQEEFQWL